MSDVPNPRQPPAADGRFERGLQTYARILAIPEAEVSTAFSERVGEAFAAEIVQSNGGRAWTHPSLRERDRIIAIMTALVCEGIYGARLANYVRLGIEAGLDEEAISAIMEILAGYIGYPRAGIAMETIHAECVRLSGVRD